MVYDVLRFNIFALDLLEQEEGKKGKELSIGDYLEREGYGQGFKEDYLLVSCDPGCNIKYEGKTTDMRCIADDCCDMVNTS